MRKLASCNRNIEEMRVRNDLMYYLVLNVQKGELKPPFTDSPPQGPLPVMSQYTVSMSGSLLTNHNSIREKIKMYKLSRKFLLLFGPST